jgi:hypothetical protein
MVRAERSIADYDAVFAPLRARREANSGKQPGDPAKAALAILKLIASPEAPAHLVLGRDAIGFVREKLGALKAEIAAWEQVSLSTDFEG